MGLNKIKKDRLEKIKHLRKQHINPYPSKAERTHTIREVISDFDELSSQERKVVICGRVMAKRAHGAIIFCDVQDGEGKIQIVIKENEITSASKAVLEAIDIGDFLEVKGVPFLTKTGEQSIAVRSLKMLTKTLRPLPKKWYGLEDKEKRFRRRYLDLLLNKKVKERFDKRIQILEAIRDFFVKKGFLEVETPVLETEYGGAEATPFTTKLEALNLKLFLRIAPELYLKRLLCDRYEKVFEMGKSFRNEGIDRAHNPEFTMLEAYSAYKDWEDFMELVEDLLGFIQSEVFSGHHIKYRNHEISLNKRIKRVSFTRLLQQEAAIDIDNDSEAKIYKRAADFGIDTNKKDKPEVVDQIYKKKCQPKLIQPTFVTKHPVYLSPLAKRLPEEKDKTARFQLILGGYEVVNAFSELNDPVDQKQRFKMQQKRLNKGKEAHPYDKQFIEALEYGLPPAAGLGIGIDRLVMVLTDAPSLREVIFFPTMRPK